MNDFHSVNGCIDRGWLVLLLTSPLYECVVRGINNQRYLWFVPVTAGSPGRPAGPVISESYIYQRWRFTKVRCRSYIKIFGADEPSRRRRHLENGNETFRSNNVQSSNDALYALYVDQPLICRFGCFDFRWALNGS